MEYVISTDPTWLDLDVIHNFLSEHSYWARGIPREIVARSLLHSVCFGVYAIDEARPGASRQQVGFARVLSDRATVAYLGDVFILPEHRGQGLSKRLMEAVMAHPDLQGLRGWMLRTADAHDLYRRFGFTAPTQPERMMERRDPDVYTRMRTT